MKYVRALSSGFTLVSAALFSTMPFAGAGPAQPAFQIRLVVAQGRQSEPPKDAERMMLMVTISPWPKSGSLTLVISPVAVLEPYLSLTGLRPRCQWPT